MAASPAFMKAYKQACLNGAQDLFLGVALPDGEPSVLRYDGRQLTCRQTPADRKRSRIPNEIPLLERVLKKSVINIHGVVVSYKRPSNTWFIAESISVGPKQKPTDFTPYLSLHLLTSLGFITVLPLCSWATIAGQANDKSARKIELPRSRSGADALYDARLKRINDVLWGRRRWYWSDEKGDGTHKLPFQSIEELTVLQHTG